jgi:hypothetical protein
MVLLKPTLTTKEVLVDFQKHWGKLTFDKIDLDFYFDFIEWCEKKKKDFHLTTLERTSRF